MDIQAAHMPGDIYQETWQQGWRFICHVQVNLKGRRQKGPTGSSCVHSFWRKSPFISEVAADLSSQSCRKKEK